ncbi:Iron transporter MagA [Candidatus Filomicrobium marinum]|uniref:Iron transporter MagA n=1 Tax=Candidatus Filomicrobium marinum TaxID=1608628 RepID=A0A0D6J9J3_9HYPH|nr:cation:proton antiporter [Candidatus Filomicrobium marinum]CFW98788.1 Iron transporter MagA [Candidatus Filomicrobium marinum]CPR14955.1 Iron transporter MagA [Candidatus Filomicrobium marinum]
MEDQLPFLLAIAIITLAAVTAGLFMAWLKQPPMVGYILAGVALGPAGVGFMPQVDAVPLAAEFGVLFLLFVIGMEVSLKAFIDDLRPAVLTVAGQIIVAFGALALFGVILEWRPEQIVLMTFVVTMSSTAVALKLLDDLGELRTDLGRIVVAVMIAQDIAIVPMLVIANSFVPGASLELSTLLKVVGAFAGLALFIRIFGKGGKLPFPWQENILGRVELVTLVALLICCTAAVLTGVAGMSPAYGAFLAGLLIGKTTLRTEAIRAMEPIQGVLMVLFFVAIGLLLDVEFIIENAGLVAVFVVGTLLLKSVANIVILHRVGLPWKTAYQAGLVMGQIGEFSFVLAAVGLANQVFDPVGYKLAISVIVLSLLFSPLWTFAVRRVHESTERRIATLGYGVFHPTARDGGDMEVKTDWAVPSLDLGPVKTRRGRSGPSPRR